MRIVGMFLFMFALLLHACTPSAPPDVPRTPSSHQPVTDASTDATHPLGAGTNESISVVLAPTAPSSPVPLCGFADLTLSAHLEGATGFMFQSVWFTNHTAQACTLQGRPSIQLVDTHGQALAVDYIDDYQSAVWRKLGLVPRARRAIVEPTLVVEQHQRITAPFVLQPHAAAYIVLRWSAVCPPISLTSGYRVRVSLHGEQKPTDMPSQDTLPDAQWPRHEDCTMAVVSVMVENLEPMNTNP